MNLINTAKMLRDAVSALKLEGKTVGFVPTMGALHAGHISLVEQCKKDNDVCVASIFVNPTQFNNPEDLVKYPRTLERDAAYLETSGVDIVFAPSVEEVYPEPDTRQFHFGQIDKVMEGKHRPGHFNGVAQVVSRLFDMVQPDRAYFGEKDFQQIAVIRAMVEQLGLPVQIVSMPIVREASGLAMSSRNERLTDAEKEIAINISRILQSSLGWSRTLSLTKVLNKVVDDINAIEGLEVEYFEIVDGYSLQTVGEWSDAQYIVGCITVYCGEVRLIDNITYKNNVFVKQ